MNGTSQGLAPGQSVGSDIGPFADGKVLTFAKIGQSEKVGNDTKVIAMELFVTRLMGTRNGLERSRGKGPRGLPLLLPVPLLEGACPCLCSEVTYL